MILKIDNYDIVTLTISIRICNVNFSEKLFSFLKFRGVTIPFLEHTIDKTIVEKCLGRENAVKKFHYFCRTREVCILQYMYNIF